LTTVSIYQGQLQHRPAAGLFKETLMAEMLVVKRGPMWKMMQDFTLLAWDNSEELWSCGFVAGGERAILVMTKNPPQAWLHGWH